MIPRPHRLLRRRVGRRQAFTALAIGLSALLLTACPSRKSRYGGSSRPAGRSGSGTY